jgi:hypothetical protein
LETLLGTEDFQIKFHFLESLRLDFFFFWYSTKKSFGKVVCFLKFFQKRESFSHPGSAKIIQEFFIARVEGKSEPAFS